MEKKIIGKGVRTPITNTGSCEETKQVRVPLVVEKLEYLTYEITLLNTATHQLLDRLSFVSDCVPCPEPSLTENNTPVPLAYSLNETIQAVRAITSLIVHQLKVLEI